MPQHADKDLLFKAATLLNEDQEQLVRTIYYIYKENRITPPKHAKTQFSKEGIRAITRIEIDVTSGSRSSLE